MHFVQFALCYRRLGRFDEVIAKHRESLQATPASLAEVFGLRPDFSIAAIPRLPAGREWLIENLRKAGLRE